LAVEGRVSQKTDQNPATLRSMGFYPIENTQNNLKQFEIY
jgi:hypothetical protein